MGLHLSKKIILAALVSLLVPTQVYAKKTLTPEARMNSPRLAQYEKIGEKISGLLQKEFVQEMDHNTDPAQALTAVDELYKLKSHPGLLEQRSLDIRANRVAILIGDVNESLSIKSQSLSAFHQNPLFRQRLQNIFIGQLHVIDCISKTQLDSGLDELLRLKSYLLSQASFISNGSGSTKLQRHDLWWDFVWLRAYNFPADLVELHLQKMSNLANNQSSNNWKSRLQKEEVGVILLSLRKNSPLVLSRDTGIQRRMALAEKAQTITLNWSDSQREDIEKELRLYQFRALQQSGQQDEANQIKKEIAMDLFWTRAGNVMTAPAQTWKRNDLSIFGKTKNTITEFMHGLAMLFTYTIGYIFVALPIELMLILAAGVILATQGRVFFKQQDMDREEAWHLLKNISSKNSSISKALRLMLRSLKTDLQLAWRMFVASYTNAAVPFYSKVAASLLIFGLGLYFNSAKTFVEAMVSHSTM